MAAIEDIIGGLEIFARYGEKHLGGAEHDEIFAGPDPSKVTPEDLAALEKMGWHDHDSGCFTKFV